MYTQTYIELSFVLGGARRAQCLSGPTRSPVQTRSQTPDFSTSKKTVIGMRQQQKITASTDPTRRRYHQCFSLGIPFADLNDLSCLAGWDGRKSADDSSDIASALFSALCCFISTQRLADAAAVTPAVLAAPTDGFDKVVPSLDRCGPTTVPAADGRSIRAEIG